MAGTCWSWLHIWILGSSNVAADTGFPQSGDDSLVPVEPPYPLSVGRSRMKKYM